MKWLGINTRMSAVSDTPGVSEVQINTRMEVEGEIQRRWGNATTSLAKQSTPILGIASAYPPGRPFVAMANTGGSLEGLPSPLAGWDDPKLKPPTGFTAGCTTFATQGSVGTTSGTADFTLPAAACAGTVTVSCSETNRAAPFYGYQFTATADGVNILTSACLVNSGTSAAIPAGTLAVHVDITGGCSGAGSVGSWTISVTTP